jgi:hypothetical protein
MLKTKLAKVRDRYKADNSFIKELNIVKKTIQKQHHLNKYFGVNHMHLKIQPTQNGYN